MKNVILSMVAIFFLSLSACAEAVTISGRIIDEKHVMLEQMMDGGVPWNGVIDTITQNMIFIKVFLNHRFWVWKIIDKNTINR